jgi:hypothetical protein
MPIPSENILPGKCYRVVEGVPRHVLLLHEKKVTFVLRGDTSWTVQRYHQDVEGFARGVECEVDYMTLLPLPEGQPS